MIDTTALSFSISGNDSEKIELEFADSDRPLVMLGSEEVVQAVYPKMQQAITRPARVKVWVTGGWFETSDDNFYGIEQNGIIIVDLLVTLSAIRNKYQWGSGILFALAIFLSLAVYRGWEWPWEGE